MTQILMLTVKSKLRPLQDLYIYQLPEHAHYYVELLNLLTAAEGVEAGHTTATTLFSKFDALRLERIVGTSRSQKMLKAASKTFLFS
jgi:U3 small nucleolar RNA-associated protein 25